MSLEEAGVVAAIVIVPPTFVAAWAGVIALGKQRGLRQELRVILDQIVRATDEYQCGNEDFMTPAFLRTSAERLRLVSERDGLKSPNKNHIGQLRALLTDVAGRFDIPNVLQGFGVAIGWQERQRLMEANGDHQTANIEQAKRRAATYLRAVNRMDRWRFWTYLRFRWFGTTSRTFPEVEPYQTPWNGPTT